MRRTFLALLSSLLVPLAGVPAAHGSPTPRVRLTGITAGGTIVRVTGRIERLPTAQRARARVALSLTDAAGAVERFRAVPRAGGGFAARHRTALDGALTLRARLTLAGRRAGALVTQPAAVRIGAPTATTPTTLVGTFRLDPGIRQPDGVHTGTYFQMFSPNGPPLKNTSSSSTDKDVTTLPPGSDGGLQTFAFQQAPNPAFHSGDSLAARIIRPQSFFNNKFGIVTDAIDPQTGATDPLPSIVNTAGRLSGQLTAWAAQWNGSSFNQGTPKPDGRYPGTTTPLTGTYDVITRHFVLTWKSLIVGGPFNLFTGAWHLEGTFVPQRG